MLTTDLYLCLPLSSQPTSRSPNTSSALPPFFLARSIEYRVSFRVSFRALSLSIRASIPTAIDPFYLIPFDSIRPGPIQHCRTESINQWISHRRRRSLYRCRCRPRPPLHSRRARSISSSAICMLKVPPQRQSKH